MKVEIDLKEFNLFMKQKQENMKKIIPDSVKKATLYMHGQVKNSIARGTNANVAVDTGRFLNSVDFEVINENSAKVFSDIEYAKFIEYGTVKMEARPHFRNTAFVETDKVKKDMGNDIKAL